MAFVNLQRLMDLNADKGEEMAQKSIDNSGLQKDITSAEYSALWHQGGLDNGAELESRTKAAQSRAATMASASGMAAGSPGMGALDGALMSQSRVGQQAQARASNLSKLMAGANEAYDARQRQTAANNRFAGMTQDANAHLAQQKQEEEAKMKQATKGYTNAQSRWQSGRYNPQTPEEYAQYSDYTQRGGR